MKRAKKCSKSMRNFDELLVDMEGGNKSSEGDLNIVGWCNFLCLDFAV